MECAEMVKEALERLIDIPDEVIASKERRFIAFPFFESCKNVSTDLKQAARAFVNHNLKYEYGRR